MWMKLTDGPQEAALVTGVSDVPPAVIHKSIRNTPRTGQSLMHCAGDMEEAE